MVLSGGMHGKRLLTIHAWPWVSSKKCFREQQRKKCLIKSSTTERIMIDALRSEYLHVLHCFWVMKKVIKYQCIINDVYE